MIRRILPALLLTVTLTGCQVRQYIVLTVEPDRTSTGITIGLDQQALTALGAVLSDTNITAAEGWGNFHPHIAAVLTGDLETSGQQWLRNGLPPFTTQQHENSSVTPWNCDLITHLGYCEGFLINIQQLHEPGTAGTRCRTLPNIGDLCQPATYPGGGLNWKYAKFVDGSYLIESTYQPTPTHLFQTHSRLDTPVIASPSIGYHNSGIIIKPEPGSTVTWATQGHKINKDGSYLWESPQGDKLLTVRLETTTNTLDHYLHYTEPTVVHQSALTGTTLLRLTLAGVTEEFTEKRLNEGWLMWPIGDGTLWNAEFNTANGEGWKIWWQPDQLPDTLTPVPDLPDPEPTTTTTVPETIPTTTTYPKVELVTAPAPEEPDLFEPEPEPSTEIFTEDNLIIGFVALLVLGGGGLFIQQKIAAAKEEAAARERAELGKQSKRTGLM